MGWIGIAVAFGGILLVTGPPLADFERARFGDMLQVLSSVTWTVYTLGAARPVGRNGALRVTAFTMLVAAMLVALPALWVGVLSGEPMMRSLLAMAFLGLVVSGLAYTLWFRALDEHGATRVGAMLYFEPFFTMGTAALMLREPVTIHVVVGGLVVLFGVWLVGKGSGG